MSRIKVIVAGDQWCNLNEVIAGIAASAGSSHLVFELNTEGPSLLALGIIDIIQREAAKIGITDDRIWIDKWHNAVEHIPFHRAYNPRLSHFFWMSDHYRFQIPDTRPQEKMFALFLGRVTVERAAIMHDLYQHMPDRVLMSLMEMNGHERTLQQDLAPWITCPDHQHRVRAWFDDSPVSSITQHRVRDQYLPEYNTNAALVQHYERFAVEIVCETYCVGDTFFPTEKTVRPISQGKPMLVYGPRHFLRRLHALGFRTWADFWDEGYDELAGVARWQCIKKTLAAITEVHPGWRIVADYNLAVLDQLIKTHRPG